MTMKKQVKASSVACGLCGMQNGQHATWCTTVASERLDATSERAKKMLDRTMSMLNGMEDRIKSLKNRLTTGDGDDLSTEDQQLIKIAHVPMLRELQEDITLGFMLGNEKMVEHAKTEMVELLEEFDL